MVINMHDPVTLYCSALTHTTKQPQSTTTEMCIYNQNKYKLVLPA